MVVIITRRRLSPPVQRRALAVTEAVRTRPIASLSPPVVSLEPAKLVQDDVTRSGAFELPLDRYRRQGLISTDQWQAGLKLREDFAAGEFERLSRANYSGMPDSPEQDDPTDISVQACLARKRYVGAMRAASPRLSPVLVHVCCLGEGAESWAVLKRLPAPEALSLLRKGLTQLADHYRRA